MALFSSKSKDWLYTLETVNRLLKEDPNRTGVSLADELGISSAQASNFTTLNGCLDQAAIDKIRSAASQQMPYSLSLNSALALAGLKKTKTGDLTTTIHTALDIALSRRLPTLQIRALVEWMVKGNPADTFKEAETGKSDKDTDKSKNEETPADGPDDLTAQVMELAKIALEEKDRNKKAPDGDKQTAARDKLKALLDKTIEEAKKEGASDNKEKEGKKSKSASPNNPSLFWEWMLGVKFMSQLKSKAKKGQLTTNDKLLILADNFLVKPLSALLENFGKLFKKMGKSLWHSVEEAAGKTVKKILAVVLPLLFIVGILWAVLAFFHFAVISPLHWMEHKIGAMFYHADVTSEPAATTALALTPVKSSALEVRSSNLKPKTPNSSLLTTNSSSKSSSLLTTNSNVVAYQPAISFVPTVEDPKILDLEIAALSDNVVLKDHPMAPDESMPGDVASSRMQDITDPDKYTMMIGSGKQTIQSVSAGNTTLSIYFKSEDPLGGFLGGAKSPLNFLWEDVSYIHINEIDHFPQPGAPPEIRYQIGLVIKGAKIPLILQCGSTDDLENLVSTMEYFIRHSRLAHDAQPAGMPYPYQGLVLNNDCVVNKLWAESPMDKAGLTLGNHLWSVGKVTSERQSRSDLEADLKTVPVTFFTASASEWDRAMHDRNPSLSNSFRPKLRKVILGGS
jgi:hypothetical protein